MSWTDVGGGMDAQIGQAAEWVTRKIDRRTVLRAGMLSGVATIGALALGQRPARATNCGPVCGPSPRCSEGCPSLGCPAGHTLCKKPPSTCRDCTYSSGSWVRCTGLGACGNGYTLCQDCVPTGSCSVCTCESGVRCGNCCSPADVQAEQQRLREFTAAAS